MIEIRTARQIGAAVRAARTQQGLTQQQLADIAGVSRGLVVRLEKGAATALYPAKLLVVLDAVGLSFFIGESQTDLPSSHTTYQAICASPPMGSSSMKGIKEQLDLAMASVNFFKTSPLLAPRNGRNDNDTGSDGR